MRFFRRYRRYMIRPIVYQFFSRSSVALAASLLLREFAGARLSWTFMAMMFVYILLAWLAWLRLDGARLPRFDHRLFRRTKPRIEFPMGDIADHIDDEPLTFEDLTEEERDACLFASNLSVALLFGLLSAFF